MWNEVQCIELDRRINTRRVEEIIQKRVHPMILEEGRGIIIPESWISTIRRRAQANNTSSVSDRRTTHKTDQPTTNH